ncbi:RNA polymerase sigma factor [Sunxiuqinia sp. A32]|uniref:RNA polymerase sigma factor n=1 Tax=Sunxiuqinia sp. A32 TaxID=3461496 RepID=UPI0040454CBA
MSPKKKHIETTYQAERQRLTGYFRKQVPTFEDAEDIAQDVFLSLTDGFDDILNLSGIISWLYSVARNKIIDFNRKKKNLRLEDQKAVLNDNEGGIYLADMLPSFDIQADDQIMNELIWETINQSLDMLPVNQREVFTMHELEGMSFEQISDLTGDSVNTLLSRKRYAVLFLRERLRSLFKLINEKD